MRVNGVVGLLVGFIGVVIITSRGLTGAGSSVTGELALLGAAFSYACGAVYSRRNVRGLAPMIPAVFQVTFAAIITGTLALLFEHPWTATPGRRGDLLDPVARHPRLGPRLPAGLPAVRPLGRDADDARRLPLPVVGIVLGYLVLHEPVDAPAHLRDRARHRRRRAGQQPVRPAAGVRARAGPADRSGLGRARLSSPTRAAAPRRRSAPTRRSGASPRNGRSPRPAGPSPRPRRRPSPTRAAAPRPTAAPRSARRGCTGTRRASASQPTAARRAAARPVAQKIAAAATNVTHSTSTTDAGHPQDRGVREHVDLARPDPVDRACTSRSSRRSRARTGSRCRRRPGACPTVPPSPRRAISPRPLEQQEPGQQRDRPRATRRRPAARRGQRPRSRPRAAAPSRARPDRRPTGRRADRPPTSRMK